MYLKSGVKPKFVFPLINTTSSISSMSRRDKSLLCPALPQSAKLCDFLQVALPLCFFLGKRIMLGKPFLLLKCHDDFLSFVIETDTSFSCMSPTFAFSVK